MNPKKSNLQHFAAAILLAASMTVAASESPEKTQLEIGVDLSRPLELNVTVDIPTETTDNKELANYLDQHGFKLHLDIRSNETHQGGSVKKITLSGIKYGKFTDTQINEYSRVITRMAAKFGRRPTWTFKQNVSGS